MSDDEHPLTRRGGEWCGLRPERVRGAPHGRNPCTQLGRCQQRFCPQCVAGLCRRRERAAGQDVHGGFGCQARRTEPNGCIGANVLESRARQSQHEREAWRVSGSERQELENLDGADLVAGDPDGCARRHRGRRVEERDELNVVAQRPAQRIDQEDDDRERHDERDQQQPDQRAPALAGADGRGKIERRARCARSPIEGIHVMMRLGHIEYSNCFPVHARLIVEPRADLSVVTAIPSVLNAALARGEIDVAPCSSIELARHGSEYRVLPDLVIGADGPVQSILLESTRPIDDLDAAPVLLPTASATSVVLLRILLELRSGLRPRYRWYDQAAAADPVAGGAAAVLRIGDVALRRAAPRERHVYDLGELWTEWTGLPFAFAVWQVRTAVDGSPALAVLHEALLDSRAWFNAHDERLARDYAAHFGMAPERLLSYWRSLCYVLDDRMQQGALHYYALAAGLDEAAPLGALPWANVTGV